MNNADWSGLAQNLLNAWLEALKPTPGFEAEFWRFGESSVDASQGARGTEDVPTFHHLGNLLRVMAEALTCARRTPMDATELLRMAFEALRQQLIPMQDGAREISAPLKVWLEAQMRPTLGPARQVQRRLRQVADAARTHLDSISTLASLHVQIVDQALVECSAQLDRDDGILLDSVSSLHAWLCARLDDTYRRAARSDEHVEALAAYVNSGLRLRAAVQAWQAESWERWGLWPPSFAAATSLSSAPFSTADGGIREAHERVAPAPSQAIDDAQAEQPRARAATRVSATGETRTKPAAKTQTAVGTSGGRPRVARATARTKTSPRPRIDPGTKTVPQAPATAATAKGTRRAPAIETRKPSTRKAFDISVFAGAKET